MIDNPAWKVLLLVDNLPIIFHWFNSQDEALMAKEGGDDQLPSICRRHILRDIDIKTIGTIITRPDKTRLPPPPKKLKLKTFGIPK